MVVSLNSRLESNKEEKKKKNVAIHGAVSRHVLWGWVSPAVLLSLSPSLSLYRPRPLSPPSLSLALSLALTLSRSLSLSLSLNLPAQVPKCD